MARDDIDVSEQIGLFIDGELTGPERLAFQARLASTPHLASAVFAEAQRMDAVRSGQPSSLFPAHGSVTAAKRLERSLLWRRRLSVARNPIAALLMIGVGWGLSAALTSSPDLPHKADANFILSAREALRVAQLNSGPNTQLEPVSEKIARLAAALNVAMPRLPSTWQLIDAQAQPWNEIQRLVITADSQSLGRVTLVAAPMQGENAIAPTASTDGRIPTVYWQSGGTAYALVGPVPTERLEEEAKEMEVATRRNAAAKVRG